MSRLESTSEKRYGEVREYSEVGPTYVFKEVGCFILRFVMYIYIYSIYQP